MIPVLQTATNIHRRLLVEHSLSPGEPVGADHELSKINRDTLPGNETAVGADLSRPPPIYRPCFSSTHFPNAPVRRTPDASQTFPSWNPNEMALVVSPDRF